MGSRRAPLKGEYCAAVLPQLRPLAFGLLKKTNPQRSWGASITPNFEGLGFPRGSKSKRACEVERLGLNRKKKDGEMVPQVSPIELSPNREALESHDPSREHGNVERIPEVTPHRVQPHGERVGSSYPIGPIMKVKYFRLNIVFESSVTVLWALVYVPDGLPIGRLNVAGSQADSVPGASTNRSNS